MYRDNGEESGNYYSESWGLAANVLGYTKMKWKLLTIANWSKYWDIIFVPQKRKIKSKSWFIRFRAWQRKSEQCGKCSRVVTKFIPDTLDVHAY